MQHQPHADERRAASSAYGALKHPSCACNGDDAAAARPTTRRCPVPDVSVAGRHRGGLACDATIAAAAAAAAAATFPQPSPMVQRPEAVMRPGALRPVARHGPMDDGGRAAGFSMAAAAPALSIRTAASCKDRPTPGKAGDVDADAGVAPACVGATLRGQRAYCCAADSQLVADRAGTTTDRRVVSGAAARSGTARRMRGRPRTAVWDRGRRQVRVAAPVRAGAPAAARSRHIGCRPALPRSARPE